MKAGLSIQQLAERVSTNIASRKDFITPSSKVRIRHDSSENKLVMGLMGSPGEYAMTDLFTQQVGAQVGVPAAYFRKLREDDPKLLSVMVNRTNKRLNATRMIRTLEADGTRTARAYLSSSYRPLDNEHFLEQLIPALAGVEGISIQDCQLTEERMYIKAITPKVQGEVKQGDLMYAGAVASNSEVGAGALSISLLAYRLVCLNGMILPDGKFRAFHLGKRQQADDTAYELLRDETKLAEDRVLLMKARDVAAGVFSQANFDKVLGRMRAASEEQLATKRPDLAVATLAKQQGLNGNEQISVLTHLLQGGDLSRWGFANAVTRMAQDVDSADRSIQLEALGAKVMELPAREWRELATATAE